MTRKDYEAIASILRCERDNESARRIARAIAGIFKLDNPRFDRTKFLEACGVDDNAK